MTDVDGCNFDVIIKWYTSNHRYISLLIVCRIVRAQMLSFEAIENIEADKACRRVSLSQTVGTGGSGFGLLSFDPISDVK
jgi:hypothetical protein